MAEDTVSVPVDDVRVQDVRLIDWSPCWAPEAVE